MKARWIIIPITALTFFCAGQALTSESPSVAAPAFQELAPEALAQNKGCLKCHSVEKKIVGPSYRDVAERYINDAQARSKLIEKVKNGGKGNWTEITRGVPMPPHSAVLSDAEIGRLVDWVLSQQDSK